MRIEIYVNTYAKHNQGYVLGGKWLYPADYDSREAFYAACYALHSDESDPELMFSDASDIPYNQNGCTEGGYVNWDYVEGFKQAKQESNDNAYYEFVENFNNTDYDAFKDAYYGEAKDEEAFADHYLEQTGTFDLIPENLQGYFDVKHFARDLFMSDFIFCNGYVFRNC